ncbi:MAG: hypothetical protein B7X34_07235, partial [Acidobacteriia bacterium 12-62-4]
MHQPFPFEHFDERLQLATDAVADLPNVRVAVIEALNAPGLPQVDWLIKWNPRSTDRAEWAAQIDAAVQDGQRGSVRWEHPRVGKRVALWEQPVQLEGISRPVRRVLRLIE